MWKNFVFHTLESWQGNRAVRCHPTNNVPFICSGVSSKDGDVSNASGDREQWEQVDTEEGEPPNLCDSEESDVGVTGKGKNEERDEEDVPIPRSRP